MKREAIYIKGDRHVEVGLKEEGGLYRGESVPAGTESGAVRSLALYGGWDIYCGWDGRRLAQQGQGTAGKVKAKLVSSFAPHSKMSTEHLPYARLVLRGRG